VTFASFGTMIPTRAFIIAMIVVSAEKAEVWEKISSIVRHVVLVCPCQWSTPINALNGFRTAIAPFVESICSIRRPRWSLCYVVIVSTKHVGINI